MKKSYYLLYSFFLFGIGIANSQNALTPGVPCPPHIRVTARPNPICYGDSSTLTAHGMGLTYLWSTGATTSSIKVSPTGNTTYYVIGTNINGCSDTVRVTVDVDPAINVSISSSPSNPCKSSTDNLTANVSGGTSPYTYAWRPASLLNSSTIYNPSYIANANHTFTCTVKDSFGCSSTATKTVTINTPPVANADSALVHFLAGDSVTATGGTPPYTYAWSPPLSSNIIVDPPAKPVTYTLTVTDANGCSSIDTARLIPTPNTLGGCRTIFISAYVQDTVNNDDAIELYNPTAGAINLKTYYLEGTTNGSALAPPFEIHLKGIIGAHNTFLIANRFADTVLTHMAKQLSDTLNFNGKDVVALGQIVPASSSALLTVLDKVGDVSTPYGSNGWTVGSGTTKNQTLVRQQSVIEGDPIWSTCMNQWNVYPRGTFSVLKKYVNVCTKGDAALTLSMGNATTNCASPSYFTFDIFAQADSASRFNSCDINIQFPNQFLGDDASNIIVTELSPFLPSSENDYGTLNVSDVSSNEIKIKFGQASDHSRQGVIINSTPQAFLEISLPIQDCTPGTVSFDTLTTMQPSFYTDSVPGTSSSDYTLINTQFSSTTYTGTLTTTVCPMHVNPLPNVNAGTNYKSVPSNSSILAITGYGFGASAGSGAILVTDANGGSPGLLDSMDILNWADSKIIVKMPNYLYGDSTVSPGTGPMKIYNGCGAESDYTNLQINYNIENAHTSPTKRKINDHIVMTSSAKSLVFRCDTTVAQNSAAYACIKKAIRTWNCFTGVNWTIGPDTGLAITKGDGVSNIYFSNSNFASPSVLMETSLFLAGSCYDQTDSVAYYKEADINMRPMPGGHLWNYDTTYTQFGGSDPYFYDAILHELGHAHGLGHINDIISLMYWQQVFGNRDSIAGGSTWPGPGTLYGAFDEVNTSAANNNTCGYIELIPGSKNCRDLTLSVPTISGNINNLDVFPDPVGYGGITIAYELRENAYIQFKITDCIGRVIMTLPEGHKEPGTYREQTNLDELAQGIYFLVANVNGSFQTIKFIKL